MNSTQITCFLTAAKAESFTLAADMLYMTPPTFGRQISAMEQELGFLLFQKEWKKNRLTPAGEVMYEGLLQMQEEYQELIHKAMEVSTSISGSLAIGVLEGQLIDSKLQSAFSVFSAKYPAVQIEVRQLSFGELFRALKKDELDAAITLSIEAVRQDALDSLALYQVENEMVISKNNILAGKDNLSLYDFADETFIDIEQEDSPVISGMLVESCRQAGFTPKVLMVKDLKSQIAAVELGRGVAAFNRYHQTCNHPGLKHIPVKELKPVEFSFIWKKTSRNTALPGMINQLKNMFQYSV